MLQTPEFLGCIFFAAPWSFIFYVAPLNAKVVNCAHDRCRQIASVLWELQSSNELQDPNAANSRDAIGSLNIKYTHSLVSWPGRLAWNFHFLIVQFLSQGKYNKIGFLNFLWVKLLLKLLKLLMCVYRTLLCAIWSYVRRVLQSMHFFITCSSISQVSDYGMQLMPYFMMISFPATLFSSRVTRIYAD